MKTLEDFKKEISLALSENKKQEVNNNNSYNELRNTSIKEEALGAMQYISDFIRNNPRQKSFVIKNPKINNSYCIGYYRMRSGQVIHKEIEVVSLIKKYCLECGLKPINYEDIDDNIYLGVSLE